MELLVVSTFPRLLHTYPTDKRPDGEGDQDLMSSYPLQSQPEN